MDCSPEDMAQLDLLEWKCNLVRLHAGDLFALTFSVTGVRCQMAMGRLKLIVALGKQKSLCAGQILVAKAMKSLCIQVYEIPFC